jgi:hypothetical protein
MKAAFGLRADFVALFVADFVAVVFGIKAD